MRYAVSGSCIMRWLITRKFNLQPGIVNIHVVTDLVKFEDMVEPQTVDCKIPSSLHCGTPKHKSTLLEITLSTLTAYVRHVYEHVVMYTNKGCFTAVSRTTRTLKDMKRSFVFIYCRICDPAYFSRSFDMKLKLNIGR